MKQLGNEASIILQPASYVERLSLDTLFDALQPLEIELGRATDRFWWHGRHNIRAATFSGWNVCSGGCARSREKSVAPACCTCA
jgi:hypothetical protein